MAPAPSPILSTFYRRSQLVSISPFRSTFQPACSLYPFQRVPFSTGSVHVPSESSPIHILTYLAIVRNDGYTHLKKWDMLLHQIAQFTCIFSTIYGTIIDKIEENFSFISQLGGHTVQYIHNTTANRHHHHHLDILQPRHDHALQAL